MLRSLLSPTLDKNYCVYFYFLSLLSLIFLILSIGSLIYSVVILKEKVKFLIFNLSSIVTFFLGYFSNRLLYTMCVASVH